MALSREDYVRLATRAALAARKPSAPPGDRAQLRAFHEFFTWLAMNAARPGFRPQHYFRPAPAGHD